MNRTNRTRAVLTSLMLAFVLTLGAGVVVGMAAGRHVTASSSVVPTPPATRPSEHRGWLPDALGLNADQREKLKAIWADAQGPSEKANAARRSQLVKERDDVLFNLLNDQQKLEYKKAMEEYSVKLDELKKEREKVIQDKVERTKLILDEKQREKYDSILKEHGSFPPYGDHPQHGGPRGSHGPGHSSTRFGEPRTQPPKAGPTTEELN